MIDIGVTNHMISTANLLLNKIKLKKGEAKKFHLPNEGVTYVNHIVSCKLSNGDIVDNVLCLPNLSTIYCQFPNSLKS